VRSRQRPTPFEDLGEASQLRRQLDVAITRAVDSAEHDGGPAAAFLNRLRARLRHRKRRSRHSEITRPFAAEPRSAHQSQAMLFAELGGQKPGPAELAVLLFSLGAEREQDLLRLNGVVSAAAVGDAMSAGLSR